MLTVRKLSLAQASTYYSKDNYYTKQQGEFFGEDLKKEFGLGDLTHESYLNLLNGINPQTGQSLVQSKAGKETNVPALDFTFSPFKSASIAYELAISKGDLVLARRIQTAHNNAVNKALSHIQKEHIRARVQKKGVRKSVITANLIAAKFQHDINRDLAPQLHTHCVVFNFTKVDGKFISLDASKLLKKGSPIIKNLGKYYRESLKEELHQAGFTTRVKDKEQGFYEIAEMNEELIQHFSSRSIKIQKKVKELKKQFPKLSNSQLSLRAFFNTRSVKKDVDRDLVRAENLKQIDRITNSDELLKELSSFKKQDLKIIDDKEIFKTLSEVKKELNKWQKTPLNMATKVMSKLPINVDISIKDLQNKIKNKELRDVKEIQVMHDVVVFNLKCTKLDTKKLFQFGKVEKLLIEEKFENARATRSDRDRLIESYDRITNKFDEAKRSNYRDASDTLARTTKRRGEPRAEFERADATSDRATGKNGATVIKPVTKADIERAERGYRDSQHHKGVEI